MESFGGSVPVERLTWTFVEVLCDAPQFGGRVPREIGAFREVLAQETVRILVASALPGAAWITEVDGHVGGDLEPHVPRHLGALIPGQLAAQSGWQLGDGGDEAITHGLCRVVVFKIHEGNETARSLDECSDCGSSHRADDEIPFLTMLEERFHDCCGVVIALGDGHG
jgi:hypothetical protein